jgi:polyhydroxyalkanoate synthesis regulator phasin
VEQIAEQTPDELESAQCRPAFRLARTLVLASLGMLSYALEIVHKLVERGELTEQEGMKLVGELSKNAQSRLPVDMPARFLERVPFRRKKKAAEAVEDEAEIPEELMTVPEAAMEAEVEPAEAPGNEEGAEEEPEKEKRSNVQTNTNILTLHFLSIGSPVIVEPDKPKKPKEKK